MKKSALPLTKAFGIEASATGNINALNGLWQLMSKNPLDPNHIPMPAAQFAFDNGNWTYQIRILAEWLDMGKGTFAANANGNRVNMRRTHFHKNHFSTLSGFEIAADPEWLDRDAAKNAKIAFFVWSEAHQPSSMEMEMIDDGISHDFGTIPGSVIRSGGASQLTILGKSYTRRS